MIVVEKYGGSVLTNINMFENLKKHILSNYNNKNKYIIVLSALKNFTNKLIDISNEFNLNNLKSNLIKEGENISCLALYNELKSHLKTKILFPEDIDLKVRNKNIIYIDINKLTKYIEISDILIVPGFYGLNEDKQIELLSRNGSDTTALYIYKQLNKHNINTICNIYKDEVLYQTDPKIETSKHLKHISFDELELIKDYNDTFLANESLNIIINNKLDVNIINYYTKEKTIISNTKSKYNLLGKYYTKGYMILITNINNNKLLNYLNKINIDFIEKESDYISLFIDKNLFKHLNIIKLIDPSIKYTITKKYKITKIYSTNILVEYKNSINEDIYEYSK